MKTISSGAMTAIEAGEAIVTGAVEINPLVTVTPVFSFNATFDYQVDASVVDADPPGSVVPPSGGYSSSAPAPFGHDGGALVPAHPIATAWAPQTSLWLKKDLTIAADGILTISGNVENGALFFIDDVLVGYINADGTNSGAAGGAAFSVNTSITSGSHTLKILALDEAADLGSADTTYFYCQATLSTSGGDAIRVWGGHGTIEIESNDYIGIGDRGLAQQTAGAVGGVAQGMTLTLSGVEPEVLALLDSSEIKGAPVVIRRLIFASDGKTLLDAHVFDRGRIDTIETTETIGGGAAIKLNVESAARGLGRSGARQRSDSDQRLIDPDDGYFKNTAYAGEKMLYWGGKMPARAGSVLRIGNEGSGG